MNSFRLALVALFASSFVVGCAVDTGSEAGTDDVGSTSDALGATANTIKGEWVAQSGVLQRLELTNLSAQTVGGIRGKQFKGVVDTGIRCITTPCPSQADVSGVYTTTNNKLTLIAVDKPAQVLQKILGDYRYDVSCGVLSLRKSGAGNELIKFTRPVIVPPAVPSCVTYKSVDSTPAGGAFYAINVPSKEDGKKLLSDRAAGIIEGNVSEGACDASQMCRFIDQPVCRREPGQAGKPYSDVCEFNAAVRAEAGDGTGTKTESKGRWTAGSCFSQQGEPCGGFTTPERQVTCDPTPVNGRTLGCVVPDGNFDAPGTCQFQ